jgi:hypothetical protein
LTNNIDFKIDAVVTWVDGYDSNWIVEKNTYFNDTFIKKINDKIRFNQCNELLLCLLGIYYYLPWINKIYLVTMYPQKPVYFDILKKYITKLELVYHHQLFPSSYLPVFNSMAIETVLHKIPNLNEHFIYFNDDTFISSYIDKSFFFTSSGKSIMYKRKAVNKYMNAVYKFLHSQKIPVTEYDAPIHQCIALTKSAFFHIHKKFPYAINKTMRSRFRHFDTLWSIGLIYSLSINTVKKVLPSDEQLYILVSHLKKTNQANAIIHYYFHHNTKLICLNNINCSNPIHSVFFNNFSNIYIHHLLTFLKKS